MSGTHTAVGTTVFTNQMLWKKTLTLSVIEHCHLVSKTFHLITELFFLLGLLSDTIRDTIITLVWLYKYIVYDNNCDNELSNVNLSLEVRGRGVQRICATYM